MSWLKIDDQIASHHKIVQAGPAAAWLWICSIAYAQNHHTDGFISDAVVEHLGVTKDVKHLSSRLLKVKLWERKTGGFAVHDYLKHNISALARRRVISDKVRAGRIGGQRTQAINRAALTALAHSQAPSQAHVKQDAKAVLNPSPLHSTPLRTKKADAPKARSADHAGGTNTAGNGSGNPRRVVPDGGPSAPASTPVGRRLTEAEEVVADTRAFMESRHRK